LGVGLKNPMVLAAVLVVAGCRPAPQQIALEKLSSIGLQARWDIGRLEADFDCDGQPDVAHLGRRPGEVVVGIVPAAGAPQILAFAVDASRQQAICAEPARLVSESLTSGPPEDLAPIPGHPVSATCKGLELSGGECDSIHVFCRRGKGLSRV
jgi:hypothetical protein